MKNRVNCSKSEKGHVVIMPMLWGMAILAIGFTLYPLIGLWGLATVWGVSLAFLWLMIESKWLTIRLPQYYRERLAIEDLTELMPLLIMLSFLCASVVKGFWGIKPRQKDLNRRQRILAWLYSRQRVSFLLGVFVILERRYIKWRQKREKSIEK